MASAKRLSVLPAIIRAFLHDLAHRREERIAHVEVAMPMLADQEKKLYDLLKKTLGPKMTMRIHVNPALLGGVRVRAGSRLIDGTLENKLKRMERIMRGAA